MRTFRFLLVIFALSGCAIGDRPAPAVLANATNKAECTSAGGRPAPNSMLAFVCKWRATDAGKACTDNRQCQGICEVPEIARLKSEVDPNSASPAVHIIEPRILRMTVPGTPMTGICSSERAQGKATNCEFFINNGVVAKSECYD